VPEEEKRSNGIHAGAGAISTDDATRERYLALARGERAEMRARMVRVAATLGWLTPAQEHDEYVRLASDLIARNTVSYAEVDLVCSLNRDATLDSAARASRSPRHPSSGVGDAALLACLGRKDAHQRVIRALVSNDERDVRIAQAYLRNRPVADARSCAPSPQGFRAAARPPRRPRPRDARAPQHHRPRDHRPARAGIRRGQVPGVQRAIAEVFIRSDAKRCRRPSSRHWCAATG
jgi:hypothetical protein